MTGNGLIYKLFDLSAFMEKQNNLDECLQELAVLAANILEVHNCSIMLLKDDREAHEISLRVFAHSGYLPDIAKHEAMKIEEGIAGYVASFGESLFVEDINKSGFSQLKRGRYKSKGFISVPIMIHDRVVGVINANSPKHKANIERRDLDLLKIISLLISKSLQIIQLQSLLRSNYAQFALARERDPEIISAGQNPGSAVRILAKTFYNEMSRAGFGPDHIITTATEILSLLSEEREKPANLTNITN